MKISLALFLLLASCANPWVMRPKQADVEMIVWRQTYGEKNPPPFVRWVTTGLTCDNATGWMVAQTCVSDQFSGADYAAAIAWPTGTVTFATTAYAHSLLHAHLYATTGDQDNAHARSEWHTLLNDANVAILKAGL